MVSVKVIAFDVLGECPPLGRAEQQDRAGRVLGVLDGHAVPMRSPSHGSEGCDWPAEPGGNAMREHARVVHAARLR